MLHRLHKHRDEFNKQKKIEKRIKSLWKKLRKFIMLFT